MDSIYLITVVLVALGGIGCLVLAATGFRNTNRLTAGLIGLLSLAYVGYILLWPGEEVWVFPFAAIIPIGAIVQAFKGPRVRTA